MEKPAEFYDSLGEYVRQKLETCKNEWRPVFDDMVGCQKRIKGECYIQDSYAHDVHWPIIPSVIKNILSVLVDIYGPTQEVPFKLRPSPLPDLPDDVESDLQRRFSQNIDMIQSQYGGDVQQIRNSYMQMRRTMKDVVDDTALDAANQLGDVIQDRLRIAGWDKAFSDFLFNFLAFPIAIMYGPALTPKVTRRWSSITNSLVFETNDVWVVENIDPLNFYISPLATDVQNAEYVIQVRSATSSDMEDLSHVAGYNSRIIYDILMDFPDGYRETSYNRNPIPPTKDTRETLSTLDSITSGGIYSIICFYGKIPGYVLQDFDNTLLNYIWYECEIYICAGRVIKAVIDPNLDKRRPFVTACMEPVPNNFYGNCVPTRLEDIERVAEASTRNLVRNMSYASGPIGEVSVNLIDNSEKDTYDLIEPFTIKAVKSFPGNSAPVYRFHNIDSRMPELMAIQENCMQWAYQVLGIPPLSAGTVPLGGVGTVGRSAAGMSIQLNQTSKTMKNMIYRLSRDVIKPIIQSFLDVELITNTDPSIRGDVNVEVIGIEGLDDDANKVVRLNQTLQSFVGYAQASQQLQGSPFSPIFMTLLRKILIMEGIDVSSLPDFSTISDLNTDMNGSVSGLPLNQNNNIASNGIITPNSYRNFGMIGQQNRGEYSGNS